MARLLVDTDVLVDHLRGSRRFEPAQDEIHYSVITRAELFAGDQAQQDAVRTLLGPFRERPVDRAIAELGGAISRSAGITLPDALIAATALSASLTVITRNAKHFTRVDGLPVREPA